jgi:UDP-N-acetylmuramyl tripeptide synthase
VSVRRATAVTAARLSAAASRALGKGGGTALPGLIATALHPDIVGELSSQLPGGSIMVTGTNGKTTTSRMLATILSDSGYSALRNESGSNLTRGLAASLVRRATLFGNLAVTERSVGLFEVDEAALAEVLPLVRPQTLLLIDLFRDQLDRYGEVATVAAIWERAIDRVPGSMRVVANADDPLVADVADRTNHPTAYFGVESAERMARETEHASDVKACPRCGGRVRYSAVFLGHLGHYSCSNCDFRRPTPSVSACDVRLLGVDGSTFTLGTDGESAEVHLPLPGMYNVYNALAAAAAARSHGVTLGGIAASLARVTAAFGRMEKLDVDRRSVYLALAKNPAGLNEVLRTLVQSGSDLHLLVMLNDNIADGRDVSWIWDADVEMLQGHVERVSFAGRRAEDIALRFKYGGVVGERTVPAWGIEHSTESALRQAVDAVPTGGKLFIVPTYTAMLDVRAVLVRLGYARQYWEE